MMTKLHTPSALLGAGLAALAMITTGAAPQDDTNAPPAEEEAKSIGVEFLEIVSADPKATVAALEALHGVTFSDPVPTLGNARTAPLRGGGRVSVRGKLRETEDPVVRPYALVKDAAAAVQTAEASKGEIAHPPMKLPGQGTFAIYLLGGIEHGLWEN